MGGIFSKPSIPSAPPPAPPAPPVQEATLQTGDQQQTTQDIVKKTMGKKKLQVPLTGATGGAGLGIPSTGA